MSTSIRQKLRDYEASEVQKARVIVSCALNDNGSLVGAEAIEALVDIVSRLRKRLRSAEHVIDECDAALGEYEDTHDGDEGRPIANAAMSARTTISAWRHGRV